MVLTDEDLEVTLKPVNDLHQRAFQRSLFSLRELGVKPPSDIWQYRVRSSSCYPYSYLHVLSVKIVCLLVCVVH